MASWPFPLNISIPNTTGRVAAMTATSKIHCTHHDGKLATVSLGFKSDQSHDPRNDSEVASLGGLDMEGAVVPFLVRLPSLARGGVVAKLEFMSPLAYVYIHIEFERACIEGMVCIS